MPLIPWRNDTPNSAVKIAGISNGIWAATVEGLRIS